MTVIIDWKKYFTFEEAKAISNIKIKENSKKFAKNVFKEDIIWKKVLPDWFSTTISV